MCVCVCMCVCVFVESCYGTLTDVFDNVFMPLCLYT